MVAFYANLVVRGPTAPEVLAALSGRDAFVSPTNCRAALAEALNLPRCSVGFGFANIEAGDLPHDMKLSDFLGTTT